MRERICSMTRSTFTASERTLRSGIRSFQSVSYGLSSSRPVDDYGDRERPQRHARQERTVVQEQIGRAPSAVTPMNKIEIAKDPIQRERNRQLEPGGAELGLCLRADRVKDVRNQR